MKVEEQLAKLAELGLPLDEGVTIDDVLSLLNRRACEERPFHAILVALGKDLQEAPWGRHVCSRVWTFDTEYITSTGDYENIVIRLCEMAEKPNHLQDVRDFVDRDAGEAWLEYRVNGVDRHWQFEVIDDWADTKTLEYVMEDIQGEGTGFFYKDAGQAMVLFYLARDTAENLSRLSDNELKPLGRK